jgi:hypothetical protein
MIASNAFRMYLRTGPSYGDVGCQEDHIIKVEFLIGGFGPPNFHQHIEDVPTIIAGQRHVIRTIDIPYLLNSKLSAYSQRAALKDYQDILALVQRHSELIRDSNNQIDPEKACIIIEAMLARQQPQASIDFVKQVLLVDGGSSEEDGSPEECWVPDDNKVLHDE